MQARVAYAAVGLFVLLLGAALLGAGLWLGSARESGEFRTYYGYTGESVAALSLSSRVTYRGVDIGRVAAIDIDPQDPTRVRLTFNIRTDAPVKTDTVATIATQGLTGLGFVELDGGTREATDLVQTPGSPYPVIPMQPSLLERLDIALRLAMSTLDQVSRRALVILNEDNTRAFGSILANTDRLTGALADQAPRIERTLTDLERVMQAGAQTTGELPALTRRVTQVLTEAEALVLTLRQSADHVASTAEQSRKQLEYTGGVLLPELEALLGHARNTADTLGELGQRLNANPQMLLLGPPQVEAGPGE